MVKMVISQFVEETLQARLEPLTLPKSGVRMSPAEYAYSDQYMWKEFETSLSAGVAWGGPFNGAKRLDLRAAS